MNILSCLNLISQIYEPPKFVFRFILRSDFSTTSRLFWKAVLSLPFHFQIHGMIEICAIASGSNGNCYYVGNEVEAVLIDLGISTKQAVQRIVEKGIDLQKIKAVFVSHEHADHVRGVRVFSKRYNIPVYFTAQTYLKLSRRVQPNSPRFFKPGESISIGSITVHSFLKNHDAVEPCSFRIELNNKHIGVFTDIG